MRSAKQILVAFIFLTSANVFAGGSPERIVFDSANTAYSRGKFEEAIRGYENILSNGKVSAEVYFNLGNAYFKLGNNGKAILNYERAKKLNPADEDINSNLKMAMQRTEDRIDEAPRFFLSQWKSGITDLMSEKAWSVTCILLLCLSLILAGTYIFSRNIVLKKTGFFGGAFVFILCILVFFIAGHKYDLTVNSSEAIIMSGSVTVTSSPDPQGTKLFILHEGTKVDVLQEQDGWIEVRIANGNVGWLKVNFLEKV